MLFRSTALASGLSALSLSTVAQAATHGACPPLGPVLPAPTQPSSHTAVQSAAARVGNALRATFDSTLNATGISVTLQSVHETAPLLELHHTPAYRDPRSTDVIDAHSVYRLGSISKLFAVLSVLKLCDQVQLDDPVTKHLPELRDMRGDGEEEADDITAVQWDQVTVGALASHMGGIGTDCMYNKTPSNRKDLPCHPPFTIPRPMSIPFDNTNILFRTQWWPTSPSCPAPGPSSGSRRSTSRS